MPSVVQFIQKKRTIAIGATDPNFLDGTRFEFPAVSGFLNVYGVSSVDSNTLTLHVGAAEAIEESDMDVGTSISRRDNLLAEQVPLGAGQKITAKVVNNNAAASDVILRFEIVV